MPYDVALCACKSYEDAAVFSALREAVSAAGGLDWVTPGMRVALKLNLVAAMKPDEAATVHPAVVCALVRMLHERGAHVVLGDSPGGLYNAAHLQRVYDATGLRAAEALGAELNGDFSVQEVRFPEAKQARAFTCTAYLCKVDAIIDVCKLKTHGMMGMTNAAKNFFGVIPGTMKPEYHYKYPKTEDFADMLVDLCEYFKPRMCICDAVVGMEGNGPTQGAPRPIGCLLAARSPHALDLAACTLIGLRPEEVPTLSAAMRRGLIPPSADGLQLFGDPAAFAVPDFKTVPSQSSVFFRKGGDGPIGKLIDTVLFRVLTPYPKLSPKDCVGCKKCANICPAKAITMKAGKPQIDRKACIHCFCCQEFCPKGAMKVGRNALMRLLER